MPFVLMMDTATAKKGRERRFLSQALADLGWVGDIVEGDEPPDFYLVRDGARIGVELRRVYRDDRGTGGSRGAEREAALVRFLNSLVDNYYAKPGAPPIVVKMDIPPVIDSPSVRRVSHAQLIKDLDAIARDALQVLHPLRLEPLTRHKFTVPHRDGRRATFHVISLPQSAVLEAPGLDRRWSVLNLTIGWRAQLPTHILQQIVAVKARKLSRYVDQVDHALLLIVADGERGTGFLELEPNLSVAPHGFREIYFQRFPSGGTIAVPLLT